MKLKNYLLSFNLLKNFLESKIHYGFVKLNKKNDFNAYLYCARNKIIVIDVHYTCHSLKQFSFLLSAFLNLNKAIVFIGFPNWFNKNWRILERISNKKYLFVDYDSKYLTKNRKKIGLIVVFDDYFLLTELKKQSNQFNIPLVGFLFNNTNNFDYLIPGNFNSQEGVLFLYYYFLNLILFKIT